MAIIKDIQLAYEVLSEKRQVYDRLWRYYDGTPALKYSSKKLKEMFKNIDARFTENWTAVVVDAPRSRMNLMSLYVEGDDDLTEELEIIFEENELAVQADALHLDLMVTGEAYLMLWPDGDSRCEITYNDARLVHLFYEPDNPRKPRFGAKWWEDPTTGRSRLTLYYPDRLEYYQSNNPVSEMTGKDGWQAYQPMPQDGVFTPEGEPSATAANPFGMVPIVQFRRELRAIKGEINQAIIDLQDTINKLMNDMMVASEFGAFKQRYIISNADDIDKLRAGGLWDIPAGDGLEQPTQVGQFTETPLSNFTGAIEGRAASMGRISNTPLSYFNLGARADPSGESLLAMEAPLITKVWSYIRHSRGPWRRVAIMALKMRGKTVKRIGMIKVIHDDPRTVQPLTLAQARQANTTAGMPLKTQLRDEGWSSEEIAQLEEDQAEAKKAEVQSMADALLQQERLRDQEDEDDA